jgi:hypothetical protein
MIISFFCIKSNKTHIFCFLTSQQWYLLWGSFAASFVCWDLYKLGAGSLFFTQQQQQQLHLSTQPTQGQTFSKLVLFEQKLDLSLGRDMVHLPTYLLTYLPIYLPIR